MTEIIPHLIVIVVSIVGIIFVWREDYSIDDIL